MDKSFKNAYRVPRITNREILELITDDGDQKQFLMTKLMESFKRPDVSKSSMQFSQCWTIKNPESEVIYTKRRHYLKSKNQNIAEHYGFLYLKTEKDLQFLATLGKIKIGNLPDSKLAVGKMGVSLSQFSDIYHPGTNNSNMPNDGILVIVKFMKGKVNYVTYDEEPMEPQPSFDCHIVRNGNNLDNNASVKKAFHSTQVFLYEYDEDADILEYPSQLLMIGAASFTWSKKYIYKTFSEKQIMVPKVATKRTQPETHPHNETIPHKLTCLSSYSKLSQPNKTNESVPIISGNLIVMDNSTKIKINVTLTSKFTEPLPLHNLIASSWELTEVIQNHIFLEFFHYMDDKGSPSVIKVSQEHVTQLPPKFYDGKVVPREGRSKHLIYLNMISRGPNDRKDMNKLIDHMSTSETVGRITTNFFPSVLFFIFPTGKISESLGIPKDDGNSLHVLLLYHIHPEIGCSNCLYRDEYIFIVQTNTYNACQQEKSSNKPLIALDRIKEAAEAQSLSLKERYGKLTEKALSNAKQNPVAAANDADSDMDVDSDTDWELVKSRKRKNIWPSSDAVSEKSPKENHASKPYGPKSTQNNNHSKIHHIPIRTPTTLPDTICFDSPINIWKQMTTVTDNPQSATTNEVTNAAHRPIRSPAPIEHNIPTLPPDQSRTASNQNPPISQTPTNHQLPQNIHLPPPNIQCHPKSNIFNHQSSPNHKDKSTLQLHKKEENVSREPYGQFRLISATRTNAGTNNFIQRRHSQSRPIRLPNLELMKDVRFISIYKG